MDIYLYEDYRLFLHDFFHEKKKENLKYSLTYFSKQIKSSDSYLKQVLAGRRSLNLDKAKHLSKKIKLSSIEESYFLTLVLRDKTKTPELKNYYENLLLNFKGIEKIKYNKEKGNKNIFSSSLAWEIYTLLGSCVDLQSIDYIVNTLTNKRCSKVKVAEIIKKLIDEKIVILENKKYKTRNVIFEHEEEVKSVYITALERAIEYLQLKNNNKDNELFDSFCMSIGVDEFNKIKQLLDETKIKMVDIVKKSKKKDIICYYNTNLFFASNMF